jgi:hypothetical protein
MKLLVTVILSSIISVSAFGQSEPSKKLPPMKMLKKYKPGEVMRIYELPEKMDYKIYGVKGILVSSGNAEFVDYTDYKKGIYFIAFGDKKEKFEVN